MPDETVIFRACMRKNDLSDDRTKVREIAFQKYGKLPRNGDGLSFQTTADGCNSVDHFGIFRIKVGDIHGLGRGIEVRFDATDASHVLLRNLPCMDREPEERKLAEEVSSELAFRALPHSTQPFKRK